MGRPGRSPGERPAPSPQEPTDPSELGGPLGLAGLLNPTGPRVGTAGFTHIEDRFQDPGGPRLALLAGNSSIHVVHDQDRRLVGFVVSLANHAQRPVPEVNRVSRLPIGDGGTQRRRLGRSTVGGLEPEQKAIRFLLFAWGRTARRAYRPDHTGTTPGCGFSASTAGTALERCGFPLGCGPPTLSRGNAPTLEQGEPASPANGTETTPAERQNVLAACG
jgi:hypothetical protein